MKNAEEHLAKVRKIEKFIDYVVREFGDDYSYISYKRSEIDINIDAHFYRSLMSTINTYRFGALKEFLKYCKNNKEECDLLIKNNIDKITAILELDLEKPTKQ